MTIHTPSVFRIRPTVQNYDWGKRGRSSAVAQLAKSQDVKDEIPYAELWMGTHTSSPSTLLESGKLLSDHLHVNPELMGAKVIDKFGAGDGNLPFLLKVLSIDKALSIQTHPDKESAEALHNKFPNIYKDANHKPEMAIALTPFAALCGFLPLHRIKAYLESTPEFSSLVPSEVLYKFLELAHTSIAPPTALQKLALKHLFSAVMTAEPEHVSANLSALVKRYSNPTNINKTEKDVVELVLTLNTQFPGDIGIFCVFLLNHVELAPGQAIFLGAGEPHAYISGDIVECMANSDNVIRAGLTPKLRDVPNLIANLTYNASAPTTHLVEPSKYSHTSTTSEDITKLYAPPVAEFAVLRSELRHPHEEHVVKGIDGPSVFIVTEGSGRLRWAREIGEEGKDSWSQHTTLTAGDVYFVGAGWSVGFQSELDHSLVIHRAFVVVD